MRPPLNGLLVLNRRLNGGTVQDEWIKGFIAQHACAATRRMYTCDLRDFVGFLKDRLARGLLEVNEGHAVAWRTELEARALKPATISRKLAVARGLFKYLLDIDPSLAGTRSKPVQARTRCSFRSDGGQDPVPLSR